jgi:hypothetical protein
VDLQDRISAQELTIQGPVGAQMNGGALAAGSRSRKSQFAGTGFGFASPCLRRAIH